METPGFFAAASVATSRSGRTPQCFFEQTDDVVVPALRWGDFADKGCARMGARKYSAILWDIPWGQSWEAACATMPADVAGHHFDHPTNCVNDHGLAMWGEFEVPDSSCK